MTARKMSPADKRRITKDWAAGFPSMGVWKPLRLARRMGPVVQGIALVVSANEDYLPTAHVHLLARPFSTISLTLAHPLRTPRGVQDRIRLWEHSATRVTAASRWLREHTNPTLDGDMALEDLLASYREEITRYLRRDWPSSVVEIEDLVLLPAVVGRTDLVAEGLEFARSVSARWPQGAMRHEEPPAAWVTRIEAMAADPEALRRTVDAEVATHKLGRIPCLPLRESQSP